MPSSTLITDYLANGLAAARPAFLPVASGALGLYFATDTGDLSMWHGAWVTLGNLFAIAAGDVLANTGTVSALPTGVTVSALLDKGLAAAQGDIAFRSGTAWAALAPGTAGQVLTTQGASANPTWTTPGGGGGGASLSVAQSWTAAQRGTPVALTDAATVASDFALGNNFTLTIGGNRTLGNPSNVVAGQAGQIVITQDGTGSRTLAYASDWKFPAGVAPVLSTAAGAVDILSYYAVDATHIAVSSALAFA